MNTGSSQKGVVKIGNFQTMKTFVESHPLMWVLFHKTQSCPKQRRNLRLHLSSKKGSLVVNVKREEEHTTILFSRLLSVLKKRLCPQ